MTEPLHMKIEPDGSISSIAGGPLEERVLTGATHRDDDWYDELMQTPEEERRAKIRDLIAEVLEFSRLNDRPVSVRTLTIDFDRRTVSVDGRVYGPIAEAGFSIPLLHSVYPVMPSRTAEPW